MNARHQLDQALLRAAVHNSDQPALRDVARDVLDGQLTITELAKVSYLGDALGARFTEWLDRRDPDPDPNVEALNRSIDSDQQEPPSR